MPALRFITEIISSKTRVHITRPNLPLGAEISRQLASNSQIELVDEQTPNVVVHLAGFDQPSLSETLHHTSHLHHLLDLALSHHARFVLVLPQKPSSLRDVALSLVTQFGKNFSLDYRVVELPPDMDLSLAAAEIIRTFVYRHSLPSSKPESPPPLLPSPARLSSPLRMPFSIPPKPVLLSLAALLLVPWLLYLVQGLFIWGLFSCSLNSIKSSRWVTAQQCAAWAGNLTRGLKAQSMFVLGSQTASSFVEYPQDRLLSVSDRLSHSLDLTAQVGESGYKIIYPLFSSTSEISSSEFSSLSSLLSRLSESLASLQGEIRLLPRPLLRLDRQVSSLRTLVSKLNQVSPELPRLLSPNGKSLVLILLQDNTEIRPTGGYLGNFALVTLENGHITQVQLYDTYTTDGQLRGNVEPPARLKTATGESGWYLRDANWDPDFPSTAGRIAWFVQKELSQSPDLVVSTNLSLFPRLLSLTGPVKLVDPPTTLDADNFYSQYLSQVKPDPASPNFISNLVSALQVQLSTLTPARLGQLGSLIVDSLNSGQIQMAYTPHTPSNLDILGWSGGLSYPACRSQSFCLIDFFYPLDSNVGVNKVNPFVARDFSVEVNINSDEVRSVYRLSYKNSSTQNVWPSGNYKNYFRAYLPSTAKVSQVLVDDKPLSPQAYSLEAERGLVSLGFMVDTPPASSSTIAISFSQSLAPTPRFHYQLDIPAQPGILSSTTTLDINYPKGWFATSYQVPSLASAGHLQYNATQPRNLKVDIDFSYSSP